MSLFGTQVEVRASFCRGGGVGAKVIQRGWSTGVEERSNLCNPGHSATSARMDESERAVWRSLSVRNSASCRLGRCSMPAKNLAKVASVCSEGR